MAKVAEGRITKQKALKRRRPTKKLKTDIGNLADALPDVAEKPTPQQQHADSTTMKMKSLRHRPGAMKRKQKMHKTEMERFGKNLAQLVGGGTSSEPQATSEGATTTANTDTHADRWKALRSFIGGTMEKDKAFAGTTGKT